VIEFAPGSLWFDIEAPRYGRQDCGIAPGGAMDRLSWQVGQALLGDPDSCYSAEIIAAPACRFTCATTFVLTGAHYDRITLEGRSIDANRVYRAEAGETLSFKNRHLGFRLYLSAIDACPVNGALVNRERGAYSRWFSPPPKRIRVFEGPEYSRLSRPETWFENSWKLSTASDRMGMRLEGPSLEAKGYDIVSAAVDDGTVQLTPSGPIVLMRDRQTTGGYPRIFQILHSDLDLLAQYPPGSSIRFERIDRETALMLMQSRSDELRRFRQALV
jgi:5-oxoprolinase (ATP-hydrolysing) subunit C